MSADDKVANKVEEASGVLKDKLGSATDDRDLQAEGKSEKFSGNLKQAGEKVKDAFKS